MKKTIVKKIVVAVVVCILVLGVSVPSEAERLYKKYWIEDFSISSVGNSTAQVYVKYSRDYDHDYGSDKDIYIEGRSYKDILFSLKVIPVNMPGALPYSIPIPYDAYGYSWNQTISLPYPGTKYAIYIEKHVLIERYETRENPSNDYGYGVMGLEQINVPASQAIIITTTGTQPSSGGADLTGVENRMDTMNSRLENIRLALLGINSEISTGSNNLVSAENQIRDKIQGLINAVNNLANTVKSSLANETNALNNIKTSITGVRDVIDKDKIPPSLELSWVDGSYFTTNSTKTLIIHAADNRTSEANLDIKIGDGSWQPYDSNISINLSSGYNIITVFVRDEAGNVTSKQIKIFKQ